jgi:hypothetical protein
MRPRRIAKELGCSVAAVSAFLSKERKVRQDISRNTAWDEFWAYLQTKTSGQMITILDAEMHTTFSTQALRKQFLRAKDQGLLRQCDRPYWEVLHDYRGCERGDWSELEG